MQGKEQKESGTIKIRCQDEDDITENDISFNDIVKSIKTPNCYVDAECHFGINVNDDYKYKITGGTGVEIVGTGYAVKLEEITSSTSLGDYTTVNSWRPTVEGKYTVKFKVFIPETKGNALTKEVEVEVLAAK